MAVTTLLDDLRKYFALLWHWVWLLVLTSVSIALATYFVNARATPVYQAVTKVLINEAPVNKATDYASVLTSERLAQTYAQLLITKPVLEAVIAQGELNTSIESLQRAVQVKPVQDTQILEIRLEDTDPVRAALILNTLFDVFTEQNQKLQEDRFSQSKASLSKQLLELDERIQQTDAQLQALGNNTGDTAGRDRLEATLSQYRQTYSNLLLSYEQVRLTEAQSTSNLVQWEPAIPPTSPIRPQIVRNTILAAIIGLALGVGAVLLIEALDDTLKGPDDVTQHLGLPVLGIVARYQRDIRLITASQPRSPVSEAFRSLRTNLQFASVDAPIQTLLVTSPSPSDGKSTVAANLGIVLAQSGYKVAIIDADLRRPRIHHVMKLQNRKGLSSLFVQPIHQIDGTLQQTTAANLAVMTAGNIPPNPSELLGSAKMADILRLIQEKVDVVVIDSPPVMAVTDSAVLAPQVDGVLLVIKPGATNFGATKQSVEQLRRVGANLLGVVLNEVDMKRTRYRYYRYKGYYYAYQQYYSSEPGKGGKRLGNILSIFRRKQQKTSKR